MKTFKQHLLEAELLKKNLVSSYITLDQKYCFAPNQAVMFRISDVIGSSTIYTPVVVDSVNFLVDIMECKVGLFNRWKDDKGADGEDHVGGYSELTVVLHRYVDDTEINEAAMDFLFKQFGEDTHSVFAVFKREDKHYKIYLKEIKEQMKTKKVVYMQAIDDIVASIESSK